MNKETVVEVMRYMGQQTSEKKKRAVRENGKLGGLKLMAACTCGKTGRRPHTPECPRLLEWRKRQGR